MHTNPFSVQDCKDLPATTCLLLFWRAEDCFNPQNNRTYENSPLPISFHSNGMLPYQIFGSANTQVYLKSIARTLWDRAKCITHTNTALILIQSISTTMICRDFQHDEVWSGIQIGVSEVCMLKNNHWMTFGAELWCILTVMMNYASNVQMWHLFMSDLIHFVVLFI